jgi:hypothetical protein
MSVVPPYVLPEEQEEPGSRRSSVTRARVASLASPRSQPYPSSTSTQAPPPASHPRIVADLQQQFGMTPKRVYGKRPGPKVLFRDEPHRETSEDVATSLHYNSRPIRTPRSRRVSRTDRDGDPHVAASPSSRCSSSLSLPATTPPNSTSELVHIENAQYPSPPSDGVSTVFTASPPSTAFHLSDFIVTSSPSDMLSPPLPDVSELVGNTDDLQSIGMGSIQVMDDSDFYPYSVNHSPQSSGLMSLNNNNSALSSSSLAAALDFSSSATSSPSSSPPTFRRNTTGSYNIRYRGGYQEDGSRSMYYDYYPPPPPPPPSSVVSSPMYSDTASLPSSSYSSSSAHTTPPQNTFPRANTTSSSLSGWAG